MGNRRLPAWTIAHLMVDLACFWYLAGLFSVATGDPVRITAGYLFYNLLAFGLQPVFGAMSDHRGTLRALDSRARRETDAAMGAAGALLTGITLAVSLPLFLAFASDASPASSLSAASVASSAVSPLQPQSIALWLLLACIAVGNALFHVGAGASVLRKARGRFAESGVFISAGALGVALGIRLAGIAYPRATVAAAALTGIGLFLLKWRNQPEAGLPASNAMNGSEPSASAALKLSLHPMPPSSHPNPAAMHPGAAAASRPSPASRTVPVVLLCLVAIFVRAFAGSFTPVVWRSRTDLFLYFLPAVCVFVGKFAGGFLADRFGERRIAVATLVLAVPLLFVRADLVVPSALGLAAVSMTTAITVTAIARALPGQEGFAFGLTTLALLAGTLPGFYMKMPAHASNWLLPGMTLFAAVCLFLALERKGGRKHDEEENRSDGKMDGQSSGEGREESEYSV